ncbi:MAG: AAA family ATPase [Candidatus Schekmanbacteria bacterium]|nr:AAA family ATPase [Candidatus Schekmanbacteria bacterium]
MEPIVEDLLQPSSWPVPTRRVELVQTHISWVLLGDADVFKLKRPVSYGFLDFRTTAARLAACEAEVRLNARLAPGVYRGVVPVVLDAHRRHRLGGPGETVDHAVHMRRLPDAVRADHKLALQQLGTGEVDRIARRLAAFHALCPSDDRIADFGTVPAITGNVRENFAQTRGGLDRWLTPAEAAEVEASQLAFLHERAALFAARIAAGRVRDGHGDLRLEHVYLPPESEVLILDCIEFNERFRYADTAADLAFLSMDLALHGRVDLAERLLSEYARSADDFDLYPLVDFYESYRAFVRGKVLSFLACDAAAQPADRARADQAARRYFLLSLAAERRSLLPASLVAVGGSLAAGKTTLADRLSLELSAPIIESDRTRKALLDVPAGASAGRSPWQGAYDPAVTAWVYAEMLRRAAAVLESGRPVILDASFRSREQRARARALAVQAGVPFRFVECRAPSAVRRARLQARESASYTGASDARTALLDDFDSRFEPATDLRPEEHLPVDTAVGSIEEQMAELRAFLATWPVGLRG